MGNESIHSDLATEPVAQLLEMLFPDRPRKVTRNAKLVQLVKTYLLCDVTTQSEIEAEIERRTDGEFVCSLQAIKMLALDEELATPESIITYLKDSMERGLKELGLAEKREEKSSFFSQCVGRITEFVHSLFGRDMLATNNPWTYRILDFTASRQQPLNAGSNGRIHRNRHFNLLKQVEESLKKMTDIEKEEAQGGLVVLNNESILLLKRPFSIFDAYSNLFPSLLTSKEV